MVNVLAHVDFGDQFVILDGGGEILFHLFQKRLEICPLAFCSGPVVDKVSIMLFKMDFKILFVQKRLL